MITFSVRQFPVNPDRRRRPALPTGMMTGRPTAALPDTTVGGRS
jgi:hypothetical protein